MDKTEQTRPAHEITIDGEVEFLIQWRANLLAKIECIDADIKFLIRKKPSTILTAQGFVENI